MIDIIVVDDHTLIREGLKKLIEQESDLRIVGECTTSAEALSLLSERNCDVLVLDINMPGRSGLDLLRDIKNVHPEVHVLILSIHPEERFALRALKAGACGYLSKDAAGEELVRAIRRINQGRKYVSQQLAETMASNLFHESEKAPHELLSQREFEILHLIGSGLSIGCIAERLCLSKSTVHTYRQRILEKMNFESTADIIRYVLENQLVD